MQFLFSFVKWEIGTVGSLLEYEVKIVRQSFGFSTEHSRDQVSVLPAVVSENCSHQNIWGIAHFDTH